MPSRPPVRVDPETTQEVLGGESTFKYHLAAATLVFWLSPSEPDVTRRTFQTMALRKRYGFAEGEPWRLRLEWRAGEATDPSLSVSTIDLSSLAIEDDQGRALAPLQLGRELDPLATLLQPPEQGLAVGTSIDLVLWGRAPAEKARLVGRWETGAFNTDVSNIFPFHAELTARLLRSGDLAGPLARLDSAAGAANPKPEGKTAPSGASTPPVRGSDGARY